MKVTFDHQHYVPCLRWKMGEYKALSLLSSASKDRITPLIEVAEMGWDFEDKKLKKTVDAHLKDFAKRVFSNWASRRCFVDLKYIGPRERMADGKHPVIFVFDDLKKKGAVALPVTSLDRDADYQLAVKGVLSKDNNGFCLRLTLPQINNKEFPKLLSALLTYLKIDSDAIDLIVDLEAPAFEPLDGFTKMVKAMIDRLPNLNKWRSFTICGASFPASMGQLHIGSQSIQRREWLFYKMFLNAVRATERKPTFGDYVIAHPAIVPMDPRIMKPSATLRYTVNDAWLIIKGKSFRDNGNYQYKNICKDLTSSTSFLGKTFSAGDDFIVGCVAGTQSLGNLTTWRWVGTNHHLEKVVSDLANLYAS